MNNKKKLVEIKDYLQGKFFERSEEIEGILIALLARQHVLLIGPAGTGKSALASELAKFVSNTQYFQWLLTRFSVPEELFGPVSLQELEQGVYKRNTSHKLPEAHIAFVDEIFKANSAILNSLLTLINERVFYNNGSPVEVPLMSIVGASNEYPEEGEGLEALFDRFLLRYEVDYVKEQSSFLSMLQGTGQGQNPPSITLEELQNEQFFCDMVAIPDKVYQTLGDIRQKLFDEGVRPSDRRFKQSLSLLRGKAFLSQRSNVRVEDILLLRNALWETVDQKNIVVDIVNEFAQDKVSFEIEQTNQEVMSIMKDIEGISNDVALEKTQKLKTLENNLLQLLAKNQDRASDIEEAINKVQASKKEIGAIILGL